VLYIGRVDDGVR